MAQRYERPAWMRRINAMAGSIGGDPREIAPIRAGELVDAATRRLGAAAGDLGDPAWRSRFEGLAAACDAHPFHVVGRLLTRQELLRALRTRLRLARAFADDPGVAEERVAAPILVTGPARSGTTILFELLALDPELRAPAAWEALHPLPPAGPGEVAERMARSECEQELWAELQPEFAAIHELRSDLPVECVTLTMPCFAGPHWSMIAQLAGWSPDPACMYAFHRRFLQVLQRGAGSRTWLLKTPAHLFTLELVFQTYPDAWVVQTHRDPARTMPSTLSTAALVQWMRSDQVDLPALRGAIEAAFGVGLNRTVEVRSGGALPDRFVDVHFAELMKDPVATLRGAYRRMGRAFGPGHAERVERYLAYKPQGKFGVHRYSAGEWGFDADAVRERLAPYIRHFGVALE